MNCLVQMQKRPKFIDAVEKFQLSGAYPVFFAILCAISGLGNKKVYLPIISLLALCVLFSVLFVREGKVLLIPILMMYYSMGKDNDTLFFNSNGDIYASFDTGAFVTLCIIGILLFVPLLIRFIADGSIAASIKHGGTLLYGILALDVVILLGGAFSKHWSFKSLLYAIVLIGGLNIFFLIIYSVIQRSDASIIPYVCRILVLTALVISVQVIASAAQAYADDNLVIYYKHLSRWSVQRYHFYFSWGLPTIVGATTTLGIPAAMYMARNERFPAFYYVCAILFWLISFVVNTRSAMIVGGIVLVVCAIIISVSGRNKRINLILSAFFFVCLAVFITRFYMKASRSGGLEYTLGEIYKLFRFDAVDDRLQLYKTGISDFLSSPIFGVGWEKGAFAGDAKFKNFYSNMYHCILIQMSASAGIVGLTGFFFHIKDIVILALKRANLNRIMILLVPIMVLCLSMVDNFFFYLNIQIFYVTFLALAQKHLEESTQTKSSLKHC